MADIRMVNRAKWLLIDNLGMNAEGRAPLHRKARDGLASDKAA